MASSISRAWINQPSTLDKLHKWNGRNVLIAKDHDGYAAVVYFADNQPEVSFVLTNTRQLMMFSKGWR